MRKITCIHPSRSRPQQAYKTAKKWIECAGISIEYILSLDMSDETIYNVACLPVKTIRGYNTSAIEAINNGASKATGDILIIVSDDTDCPENWGVDTLKHLDGKSDFCAKVDDGLQPTLVTMPVMDRVYYERYGYIYESGYDHLFCDQELTAVAIMTGKYIKIPLLFQHMHYSTGLTQRDSISEKNDMTWMQGEDRFNNRLKDNFGINSPVVAYNEISWR